MTKKKTTELQIYNNNTNLDIKRAAWSALSPESKSAYQSDFNLFFNFIKKEPKAVTANDILSYIEYLEKNGYKNSSINRKVASLSKMFRILVMAHEIKTNPVQVLKEIKKVSRTTSKEVRISLTLADIKKATNINNFNSDQERKLSLIIKTLAMTGLRISELINIRNGDITDHDSGNKKIRIMGKGKKERYIYLDNDFIKQIRNVFPYTKPIDFLFYNSRNTSYDRRILWKQIKDFFQKKIHKDVHPHLLRHFFATHKINIEKQDIKAVSKFLGHSNVSITLEAYVDTALDVNKAKIKI